MNMWATLFWILLFLVFYSYVGYALLLGVLIGLGFKQKDDLNDPEEWPPVALIVPCFNEAGYIEEKIENSLALDYPGDKIEYIFISDGSSDETPAIVKRYEGKAAAMHEDARRGKAAAMNRAVGATTAEILIFCDANTELNAEAVKKIARHYKSPKIGGVAGVKIIKQNKAESASGAGEGIYWKYESTLKKWDSRFYTVVGAAGELMSYRRALYEELPQDTILDDFMQSMRVCEKGYRVVYEPEARAAEWASANVEEELKRKIRIAAGGWQSVFRLKRAGNPFFDFKLWFQYVSHRVMRWSIGPVSFFLLVPLVSFLYFSGTPGFSFFFWAMVGVYIAIAIGRLLNDRKTEIKIFWVPYYFFVMNYAVVMGLFRFLKGNQSSLWERAQRAR